MAGDEQAWHLVEARRDDGTPAMFRIRDVAPLPELKTIFVIELPYPPTELSRMPDASSYRRLQVFEEQWLIPAASSLGWMFVAAKTEDGSFFLYLYGDNDPNDLIARLSPFDGSLGFFEEQDPTWDEYAALKELLDEANAMPAERDDEAEPQPEPEPTPARNSAAKKKPAPKKTPAPAKKKPATKKPKKR
ncbi:MAG: DUF695 domain-containing protein [Deltaproteobacteria bacterium]|nr:DUF695 domain-containing protein [Deltaproteobacteria bacterium]